MVAGDRYGDRLTIENIQINGNRPALDRVVGGDALIEIGGNATGQIVQNVHAYQTRSWSTLHLFEGTVVNDVPPASRPG